MKSLQQFLAFAISAKHLSFASAARELGLEPSTVAKSVGRLESALGVNLFYRTTRQMKLTPDGDALYERFAHILEEVSALEATAATARSGPNGILKIDAPVVYGRKVILPIMTNLLECFPQLQADIRLSDTLTDVIADGFDAVVRIGALKDSRLVARQIDKQQLITCASAGYLRNRGVPADVATLPQHQCLVFRLPATGRQQPWQFLVDGESIDVHYNARVCINDGEALVEAAVSGAGIAQVPHYMAIEALSDGALVEILAKYRPAPIPINIVTPGGRIMPPRVRVFIDAMVESGKATVNGIASNAIGCEQSHSECRVS